MTQRIWLVSVLLMLCAAVHAQTSSLISEIEIRGALNVNKEAIVAVMRTKVGQPYVQAQLDTDRKTIDAMGFFQAVDVRANEIGNQSWRVVVEVVEFPKIKEIRIIGNTIIPTAEILKVMETAPSFPIAPGNVYNLTSVRAVDEAIRKLYTDKRYFAQVTAFGPLESSPETINVEIVELTVNSVSVQGANRTKKSVLDKIIRTRAGQPFNVGVWENDLRRLYSTQWFEKIDSIERPSGEDIGKLDLIADVKETQTGTLNVGLQIDPRSSIAGLVRYGDSNFRGSGQSVGLDLVQGSKGGLSIDLDYGNPFVDNNESSLNASVFSKLVYRFSNSLFGGGGGGSETPTNETYFERRTGASIGLGRRLAENLFGSIGAKFENIKTTDLDPKQTEGFVQQDGDVASVSFSLTSNRRDVDVEPSRGSWYRLAIEPGYSNITKIGGELGGGGDGFIEGADILGPNTFFRTSLEYRAYFSPGQPPRGRKLDDPRRTIAVRARAGITVGNVPFFEQFFVGGSDSLRGYAEDRFWGRNQALLTVEYRHPIQKSFNVILFADYGGAWGGYGTVNEYVQSNSAKMQLGYGMGLSFRTPLGPIRLDFGFDEKGATRTHFLIGTSF